MSQHILIVAAHADDEVLGCGGTIARHVKEGDLVSVLFLTNGVGARYTKDDSQEAEAARARKDASLRALAELGIKEDYVAICDFPDNALDRVPLIEVIQVVEKTVDKLQPSTLYTHHPEDLNIDHRCAYQAVMTACRPQPSNSVKSIYSFEVASSTAWGGHTSGSGFNPNHYKDISGFWTQKLAALQAYEEEMRPAPHARSIEALDALSIYRGSQTGLSRAEAFCVERIID